MSITSNDSTLNGSGKSGYGGIWENPPDNNTYMHVTGYSASPVGDPPVITTFTSTPPGWSGTYPVTVTFNAAATYANGTITAYILNYDDGSAPLEQSGAIVNQTHSYTAAPTFAYTATLTVADSAGSLTQQQLTATAPSVSTSPAGAIATDRVGGNGTGSLQVNFQTSGTAYSGKQITGYVLNFGDDSIMNVPVQSGVTSFSINTTHTYSTNGSFNATLTVIDSDGATKVITQNILFSSTPPTVVVSFNTATSILSAAFSEDVGAALVSQTASNGSPLGESLWVDAATSAGSIATALDIRNDSSGGNLTLTSAPFSYNASTYTGTWNLTGLLNTSSTSYTARLFAIEIQDQAGNDLDGINSGQGGQDADYHFGHSYPATNVTLATGGVWNSSMPLVLGPAPASTQIYNGLEDIPGDGSTLTTVNVAGVPSTKFTFPNASAYTNVLGPLSAGSTVIVSDLPSPFNILDGIWQVNKSEDTHAIDIPVNSSTLNDAAWSGAEPGFAICPQQG